MRVLQLMSSGAGFYGAERVCVLLSAELQQLGVDTVVGAFRKDGKTAHRHFVEQALQAGLQVTAIDCKGRLDANAVSTIRTLVSRHKIDIIHGHGIKSDLYAYLASRGGNVRLVGTCHSWTTDSAVTWGISIADRLLLRNFDAVAIVSGTLRKRLRRLGIRRERIRLVENGIDCAPFALASCNRPRRGAGSPFIVGTVSRLVPVKGLRYLLAAAAALLKEFPWTKFVIVGDGPELGNLQRQATKLGIDQNVEFVGIRRDMPEVYASFDAFALPSLSEAMPMALIEAMASGRPVVASSVGEIPNMIADGRDGMLVEPTNTTALVKCLRSLLSSSEMRAALGRAAQNVAMVRFSSTSMARTYLSLYESVMGQNASAPLVRSQE